MVAQKKGAAKQRNSKVQGKQTPAKMFEEKFDDIDAEMDSDSDTGMSPAKKTPNKGTPGPKSAKKDMHVSFQLQGKTPNSGQKQDVQKGRTPTPMVPKKQQTQSLREQTLKKGMVGSPNLKAGTPQKNQTGGKGKRKAAEEDDDDDDFEDDDDEDDIDLDDDDEDDDGEGFDIDDDDDDDDEDDDEDLDSEEEKKIMKAALKGKNQKAQQKTPAKQAAADKSPKKDSAKSPKNQNEGKNISAGLLRRNEQDKRTLFLKNLPSNVTEDAIKTLSPDIVFAKVPFKQMKKKGVPRYAFLEFESEQKAEENFKLLSGKKLGDKEVLVDYCGIKSTNKLVRNSEAEGPKEMNLKKLYVTGLSDDTTIGDVANLFPKAYWVMMSENPSFPKAASVLFREEDAAAEAMKKQNGAVINGRTVSIIYSLQGKGRSKFNKIASLGAKSGKNSGPPAKRQKREPSSDDDE